MLDTPWGTAQQIKEIAPGITQVSTAGHGGIQLSEDRQRQMPEGHRHEWFEEDCEWALPTCAFAPELDPKEVWFACECASRYHPSLKFPEAEKIAQEWEKKYQKMFLPSGYLFDGGTQIEVQTYRQIGQEKELIVTRKWEDGTAHFPSMSTEEEIRALPNTKVEERPCPTPNHP